MTDADRLTAQQQKDCLDFDPEQRQWYWKGQPVTPGQAPGQEVEE